MPAAPRGGKGAPRGCGLLRVDTHGFRLKRSLNPDTLVSLFRYFSATSFSFVQVICTLSSVHGAWVLAATAEWEVVFLSWIS